MQEYVDEYYLSQKYGGQSRDFTMLENEANESGTPGVVFGNEKFIEEIINDKKFIDKDSNKKEVYQYILDRYDIENFIDYTLLNTYYGNVDWITSNVRFWKYNINTDGIANGLSNPKPRSKNYRDGKWRYILQDLDVSFGLSIKERGYRDNNDNMIKRINTSSFKSYNANTIFFRKLFQNEEFKSKFFQRYKTLKYSVLTPEHIINNIDESEKILEPHVNRYFKKWSGTKDNQGNEIEADINLWKSNIEELRQYAKKRPEEFDKQIKEVLGYEYEL
jgi:hypothetical protein